MMPPLKDLTGQKFGRLTVIGRAESGKRRHIRWLCQCECGKNAFVCSSNLMSGHTRSCGCLSREQSKQRMTALRAPISDGRGKERLYHIWRNMIHRCYNPNNTYYQHYGGRGIKVCEVWQHDYPAFRAWALANGYRDDLSIDRIDNGGNYEPGNCRWADAKMQARNVRTNRYLTHNGETLTLAEWVERTGIAKCTILRRLELGWSVERALTELVKKQMHKEEPK